MIDLTIVLFVLGFAVVLSELALGPLKVQTALPRLVGVWGVLGVLVMAHFALVRGSGALVFGVFWAGAFLAWFGVRSHVESSILLRMLYLLRSEPLSGDQVVAAYEAQYGPQQRIDELLRGGLLERSGGGYRVTAKGQRIVAAVDRLK
jgi:hypothetical protein